MHMPRYECVWACECESDFSYRIGYRFATQTDDKRTFPSIDVHFLFVYLTGMRERIRIYGYTHILKSDAANADVSA